MIVNKYDEYKDVFWGEESLHYSLDELEVWDIEKYWKLEYSLIKLCGYLKDKAVIDKELAGSLYYLSRNINSIIEAQKMPLYREIFGGELHDFDEDEGYESLDRLNHVMRIIWGKIPLEYGDTLLKNPLIKRGD